MNAAWSKCQCGGGAGPFTKGPQSCMRGPLYEVGRSQIAPHTKFCQLCLWTKAKMVGGGEVGLVNCLP
jgi:hypothetical protein